MNINECSHTRYSAGAVAYSQVHMVNREQLIGEHGVIGKIFFVKKYLTTSLVFMQQKWFLHQNGVEFNKKSKSELTILWLLVGR